MNRTVLYGDVAVPIHERPWQSGPRQPYRQTYHLQPGESWLQATTSSGQWEHYVQLASGEQLPVGAVIARELMAEGALAAYFTELWIGRCVLVGPDLMCVKPQGAAERFLAEMRGARAAKSTGCPTSWPFSPTEKSCCARRRMSEPGIPCATPSMNLPGRPAGCLVRTWTSRSWSGVRKTVPRRPIISGGAKHDHPRRCSQKCRL